MSSNKEKQRPNYLTHSLQGSSEGQNTTQTLTNILNQTTVKPSTQSGSSNQPKKGRD